MDDLQPETGNTKENSGKQIPPYLTPWKPGQSGNPKGRPKLDPEVKALLEAKGPRAIARLCELIESEDERIALMASKEIADRAYGKAKPSDDEDGEKGSVTINIVRLGDQASASETDTSKRIEGTTVHIRRLDG